jgi:RimK-like ATP-grasp domain
MSSRLDAAMILILSFHDNEHVEHVLRHLTSETVIIDTGQFPSAVSLSVRFDDRTQQLVLALPDGRRLDLEQVNAVWSRRIRPLGLHSDLAQGTAQTFAWSESHEALTGLWYSLGCFWMNHPLAEEESLRKIRQLQVAREVGLAIPETLITSDPTQAREFVEHHGTGNVVRKAFRNIAEAPRQTLIVAEPELAYIDSVRYAPVIFQRYVSVALDLRVTVVENDVFAAAIRSEPAYHADYRLGLASADVTAHDLPDEITTRLLDLMRALRIGFGAIDMRLTPDGEYVFLEVNPAGEYLFVAERTGQPIPAAIAACLERHELGHPA